MFCKNNSKYDIGVKHRIVFVLNHCEILIVCVLMAIVSINFMYVDEKLPAMKLLGLFHVTVFADNEQGGSSEGNGMCTERGGSEEPQKVLLKNTCTKEVQVKVGTSWEWKKVNGNECKCKKPDRSYQGSKGCNLSWETACK